ncbi:hypothetical protein V8B97DRAFT_1939591, partial [Scleroderma yunnanense]
MMLNFSQTSVDIDGVQTDILVQPFADRIFVLITQVGKVGNLIQVSMPSTAPLVASGASDPFDPMDSLPTPPATIQLQSLLGSTSSEHLQTLHSLYAAQTATLVWLTEDVGSDRRSIIVGIALRKFSAATVDELNEQERRMFRGTMRTLMSML